MEYVSPSGPVYQAGTLSGNPIAMAAGFTMLNYLDQNPSVYSQLEKTGSILANGIKEGVDRLGLPYTINHLGSMYTLFFTNQKVKDFAGAQTCDTSIFGKYFRGMLDKGVYLAPSQYESLFLSVALDQSHLDQILDASEQTLKSL
jgi:glutamate-1-semialdehyde 2,1-aminomutase